MAAVLLLAQTADALDLPGKVGALGVTGCLALAVFVLYRERNDLLAENRKLRDDRIQEQADLIKMFGGHKDSGAVKDGIG